MTVVRETAFVSVEGDFNRIELIDCGQKWEISFYKQYRETSSWNFYKVDRYTSEENARMEFSKYKHKEKNSLVAEFNIGRHKTKICKNTDGTFDAIVTNILAIGGVRRSQKNMTVEETIGYLANAANR